MAKDLLAYYDELVANSIQQNLYSDTNPFTAAVAPRPADSTTPNTNLYNDGSPSIVQGGSFAPIAASVPPALGVFDIFATAHWLRAIGQEFGVFPRDGVRAPENVIKGITFAATQFLLAAFNPGDLQLGGVLNQIYNPLSLPLSAVPLTRGYLTIDSPNAAAALSVTGDVYSIASQAAPDRHQLMRLGAYKKAVDAGDIARLSTQPLGFRGDIAKAGGIDTLENPGQGFNALVSIQGQVDQEGPTALVAQSINIQRNIYTSNKPYSENPIADLDRIENAVDNQQFAPEFLKKTPEQIKLDSLFVNGTFPGGLSGKSDSRYTWIAKRNASDGFLATAASFPQDLSVNFPGEGPDGLVSDPIPDDQIYMPFTFQDLRDPTNKLLYFRAFLKQGSLVETFVPEWQTERFYGRVDEVPVYQGTSRAISFGFDVVSWSPSDLATMWQKLHILQSFVYPLYDSRGYIKAGPLIRIRVGDLICAARQNNIKKGLPGYITALDFAYDDDVWNLKEDFKVPRKVSVNISFTVVHDGNPGIYPFTHNEITPEGFEFNIQPEAAGNVFGAMQTSLNGDNVVLDVKAGDIRGVVETVQAEKEKL